MQYVSVRSVQSRLKSQFKVDMDIYDIIQGCSDSLRKMGAIALDRSVYCANVSNYCVNLPGTIWKVRSVIALDDPSKMDPSLTVQDMYFPPQVVFTMDERETVNVADVFKANYVPRFTGPYIDYVWKCPMLKFNVTDVPVAIETTGIKLDEEGYPMIPEPGFFGCLYYCLFIYYQPLFLLKQISPQQMGQIEAWMNQNVAQSNQGMMMESLTANERDKLFDIMTSMDRKSYKYPV